MLWANNMNGSKSFTNSGMLWPSLWRDLLRFTIAAGLFEINLITFVVVVVLSRGARFFLLGGLIWWFGPSIQNFVDRYFNLLVILFSILLVGGFFIVRYAFTSVPTFC